MYTRGRLTSYNEWDQGAFKNSVIRVGRDYQAIVPPLETRSLKSGYRSKIGNCNPGKNFNRLKSLTTNGGTCLWVPIKNDDVLHTFNKYLIEAKSLYDYNEEQALALLMWHFQEVGRAMRDLPNFLPTEYDWKKKEVLRFFMAIREHSKNFNKIKRLFPHRKVSEMIQFYYLNKKKRSLLQSLGLFDNVRGGLIRYCNRDILLNRRYKSRLYNGINSVRAGVSGWRENYKSQAKNKDDNVTDKDALDIKYALPADIHYNHEEFVEFCQKAPSSIEEDIEKMNSNINNKQKGVTLLHEQLTQKDKMVLGGADKYRPNESVFKPSQKWTKEDFQVVVQAVRHVGRDYVTIADIMGSKTKSMVETFLTANSRRFNLDELEAEFHRSKNCRKIESESVVVVLDEDASTANETLDISGATDPVTADVPPDSLDESSDNLVIAL